MYFTTHHMSWVSHTPFWAFAAIFVPGRCRRGVFLPFVWLDAFCVHKVRHGGGVVFLRSHGLLWDFGTGFELKF